MQPKQERGTFALTINVGSEGMSDVGLHVAEKLHDLHAVVGNGVTEGTIMDTNGNTCGFFKFTPEAEGACIQRTYFGGGEAMSFESWARECIQDEDAAIVTANEMLRTPQFEREWNDGDHPTYFEKFFITDENLFREQLAEFATEE